MAPSIGTVSCPVTDLERGKAVFTAILGSPPVANAPSYLHLDTNGQEIGFDPNGTGKGMSGPLACGREADLPAALAELTTAGATQHRAVQDVGGGRLIDSVTDADSNQIGLLQPA